MAKVQADSRSSIVGMEYRRFEDAAMDSADAGTAVHHADPLSHRSRRASHRTSTVDARHRVATKAAASPDASVLLRNVPLEELDAIGQKATSDAVDAARRAGAPVTGVDTLGRRAVSWPEGVTLADLARRTKHPSG